MLPGALNPRDLVMYVGCVALSGPVCARVNPPSGSWAGVPTFHQVGLATHRWARGVTGCCVESVDPYWCVHGTAVARVRGHLSSSSVKRSAHRSASNAAFDLDPAAQSR